MIKIWIYKYLYLPCFYSSRLRVVVDIIMMLRYFCRRKQERYRACMWQGFDIQIHQPTIYHPRMYLFMENMKKYKQAYIIF